MESQYEELINKILVTPTGRKAFADELAKPIRTKLTPQMTLAWKLKFFFGKN
jgi:hypothetical protein